jgi:hypothetical protein
MPTPSLILTAPKGADCIYYWQSAKNEWRKAAPLPRPFGDGQTLAEMRAEVERMGFPCVWGYSNIGSPEGAPAA